MTDNRLQEPQTACDAAIEAPLLTKPPCRYGDGLAPRVPDASIDHSPHETEERSQDGLLLYRVQRSLQPYRAPEAPSASAYVPSPPGTAPRQCLQTLQLISPVADQGEKPYSCAYCSLSSSRKDVILRHTRNFHPGMVPNRAGVGSPTPANADGDTAQTISSPSSTSMSQDGGSTQTGLRHGHPPEGVNELCPVFSDSGIHFPDIGLFRSGTTTLPEPSLREDLVVDMFPPNDPNNSDLWDMLLGSVPDITSGALSHQTPSNLQALPVRPPLSPDQTVEEKKSVFGFDNAGYEQAQANLASYDPDKKLLNFRFPSRHAVIRYVKAYYEYMDPQLPIVHGPTLDAATVPCTCTTHGETARKLTPT